MLFVILEKVVSAYMEIILAGLTTWFLYGITKFWVGAEISVLTGRATPYMLPFLVMWGIVYVLSRHPHFWKDFEINNLIVHFCMSVYTSVYFLRSHTVLCIGAIVILSILSIVYFFNKYSSFSGQYKCPFPILPAPVNLFIRILMYCCSSLLVLSTVFYLFNIIVSPVIYLGYGIIVLIITILITVFLYDKIIVIGAFNRSRLDNTLHASNHPDLFHKKSSHPQKAACAIESSHIEYNLLIRQIIKRKQIVNGRTLADIYCKYGSDYYIFDDGTLIYCHIDLNDTEHPYTTYLFGKQTIGKTFTSKELFAQYINGLANEHECGLPPFASNQSSPLLFGSIAIFTRKQQIQNMSDLVNLSDNEYLKWEAGRRNITVEELSKQCPKLWYYYRHIYFCELEVLFNGLNELSVQILDEHKAEHEDRKQNADSRIKVLRPDYFDYEHDILARWRDGHEPEYPWAINHYKIGDTAACLTPEDAKAAYINDSNYSRRKQQYITQQKVCEKALVVIEKTMNAEMQTMVKLGYLESRK